MKNMETQLEDIRIWSIVSAFVLMAILAVLLIPYATLPLGA
jgi:hypothetical protein